MSFCIESHDSSCNGRRNSRLQVLQLILAVVLPALLIQGCSQSSMTASTAAAATQATPSISISPSTASVQLYQNLQFSPSGEASGDACTWQSSQSSILANLGNGQFQGVQQGNAQVSVTCGSASATASVVVSAQQASGPITITAGGTYSGNWNSTDPSTPAVTIATNQPVTIQDSVITSRGTLIEISGGAKPANVIIENVTGTALDPEVSGKERGAFVASSNVASLVIENCSIIGASFGVNLSGVSPSTLQILNNSASNLEDRASDGNGGFLNSRPSLGHFVILNNVTASAGAEIAWNQIVQTIGQSSTEDVINIFNSEGSAGNPISVHDNYMEGNSSPASNGNYTGTALISDGPTTNGAQPTAYVVFQANEVVATAGAGVMVAAGHDIQATDNRIISCGMTSAGSWYAWGANAIVLWNYYSSTQYYNNTITGTVGGMVGPGTNDAPKAFDVWVVNPDTLSSSVSTSSNDFTDPCLVGGKVNLQAEANERAFWAAKIASNSELVGDQHLN